MANDWLMGDTKTGEIASLELAFRHHSLNRTINGFLWSCNNAKDDKVRWVLNSFTRLGIFGRIFKRNRRRGHLPGLLRAHRGVARVLELPPGT